MKTYEEWRYSSTHIFLPSALNGEWSASRPGRFTPEKRAPGTHRIGGWMGPRADLDDVEKRKSCPYLLKFILEYFVFISVTILSRLVL
jgi:hypothetical protein